MDLFDQLRLALRKQGIDTNAQQSYLYWIRRFLFHHGCRNPKGLKPHHLNRFLNHLAQRERLDKSTQQQAHCAVALLYQEILNTPLHPEQTPQQNLEKMGKA